MTTWRRAMAVDTSRQWLSLKEAASELGVSKVTVQRWIKQGRLAAQRVGPRKLRILQSDLATVVAPAKPLEAPEWVPLDLSTIRPITDEDAERHLEWSREVR